MFFAAAILAAATAVAPATNIFSIAHGGVVVSTTGDYSMGWSSIQLIDGDPRTGWCSPDGTLTGTFVIELARPYKLRSVTLDSAGMQESSYPGITARNVEIWTSSTSATSGFVKAAAVEAPRGGRKEFALPSAPVTRWLKVVVTSNWGHKQYTELGEIEAYGEPEGAELSRKSIVGSYDTNYGRVQFASATPRLTGCYDPGGFLSGTTDGRTVEAEWRSAAKTSGGVLFSVSSDGALLNGVWYERGVRQGMWYGKRTARPVNCPPMRDLAASLKDNGRAIAYGIRFDSDSAKLTADSVATLEQIESLLKKDHAMKLAIEGHTDSTNTDAYNLELSKKRAEAVVAWLTAKQIEASRLKAVGHGRTKPIADNATPQGRALNRRVEIAAQ